MTHKQRKQLHEKIADYIRRHENDSFAKIAEDLGGNISVPTLSNIAIAHGIRRGQGRKQYAVTNDLLQKLEQ
jgi:hypothetical protein